MKSLVLFIFFLGSCLSSKGVKERLQTRPTISPLNRFELWDPKDLEVFVTSMKIKPSTMILGFQVPVLEFQLLPKEGAYVDILRCESQSRPWIESLILNYGEENDGRQWAWKDLLAFSGCQVAVQSHYDFKFEDMATALGKHFYVINPCLDQAFSSTSETSCQGAKIVTDDILSPTELRENLRLALKDEQEARRSYEAISIRLASLARDLERLRSICLWKDQKNEEAKKAQRLWTGVGSLIAAGGLGALAFGVSRLPSYKEANLPHPAKTAGALFVLGAALTVALNETVFISDAGSSQCSKANDIAQKISNLEAAWNDAKSKLLLASKSLADLDEKLKAYDEKISQQLQDEAS